MARRNRRKSLYRPRSSVSKIKPVVPSNWDDEPETELVSPIQPGDMVIPTVCLETSDEEIEGHPVIRRPWAENALRDVDGNPTLDGERRGIYIGQKRLCISRSVVHDQKHWSGRKQMNNLHKMFHVFVFGSRRVIIDMQYVQKLQ